MSYLLSYYNVSLALIAQQAASQRCFLSQKRRNKKNLEMTTRLRFIPCLHLYPYIGSRKEQLSDFNTYEKQLLPTYWTRWYIWQLTSHPTIVNILFSLVSRSCTLFISSQLLCQVPPQLMTNDGPQEYLSVYNIGLLNLSVSHKD